ncbi:MAG: VOC family protein [Pyrinomonadaceae bacterium]
MAKPSKFAHVVYSTRRFDDMIDWYQRVFEAKVVYQNPAFAFLTYDDEHHRFAFANHLTISVGDLTYLKWAIPFESFRDDSRYKDLLKRMNLPE